MRAPLGLVLRVIGELSLRRLAELSEQAREQRLTQVEFITRRMAALDMAPQKHAYHAQLREARGQEAWRT